MARPSLALGTHGSINTIRLTDEGVKPERWRARTRFRDLDGVTRPVERFGPSRTKAESNLQQALQKRLGTPTQQINNTTRVRDLADIYLANLKAKVDDGKRAASTYDRYLTLVTNQIIPHLGGLTARECDASRLQDVLDELERNGVSGSTRSSVRTVMRGIMQLAVRKKLVGTNPGRDLDRIEGVAPKRKARALTKAQFLDFMTKLDADKKARRNDILDIVRTLFAVGIRLGEALALRWKDLNLTDSPVRMVSDSGDEEVVPPRSLWVNGGVVYVVGQGAIRNGGKTFHSRRVLGMPDFLHTLLLVRRDAHATDEDPVFPGARASKWRYPKTVGRFLKEARERIGYPEVTSKWGRKTVATLLDEAGQTPRQVADQLGHSSISTTQKHYLARGMANPGAVAAIDAWHKQPGQ